MAEKIEEAAAPNYIAAAKVDYRSLLGVLRSSEWVIVIYFIYTACLALVHDISPFWRAMAFAGPCFYYALGYFDSRSNRLWVDILRDWLPPPLILVAYWQLDWFYTPQRRIDLEQTWLAWDRVLLHQWGFKAAVESLGPVIPGFLELCYVLLYTVPPVSLATLYLIRRRDRVDRLFLPLMMGTLLAYATLPHFPSASPRVEFPNQDLPEFLTAIRRFNIWILDHADIHTSVFPSGHVATSFSSAFAMMMAMPERKWMGRALLILATIISTATIYGRYHYAADAIAGLAISLVAVGITYVLNRD